MASYFVLLSKSKHGLVKGLAGKGIIVEQGRFQGSETLWSLETIAAISAHGRREIRWNAEQG